MPTTNKITIKKFLEICGSRIMATKVGQQSRFYRRQKLHKIRKYRESFVSVLSWNKLKR
jgi:hypothetical protein